MTLVTDTWGANLNPAPKSHKVFKTLSATAVSGSAVTDTENFFLKNAPWAMRLVGFELHGVDITPGEFDGTNADFTVTLQSSTTVDASPATPTSPSWDNLFSQEISASLGATDKLLLSAPSNASGVVNVSLDQTYVLIPKGGSLRVTISAQAEDEIGVSGESTIEALAIATVVPTEVRDQRYV